MLTIREFHESDREALRALFVVSRINAFSWAPPTNFKPEDFDNVTQDERILVAVHDKCPVGFASIWESDSFLHNLFVHPDYQGCGVGKQLLEACKQYFIGVPTLKCLKANERAGQFYQSQGWRVRSEGEGPDGAYLLMEWIYPGVTPAPSLSWS